MGWRLCAIAICTINIFALQPEKAVALTFATYDTSAFGELLTTLPGDDVPRVLYSIDVGPINADDALVVYSEAELTNHTANGVRLGAILILGSSASATTGTELSEYNSFKITPGMFHGKRNKNIIKKFASSQTSTYVNFVVNADDALEVEQNYGRIQVLKISP